MDHTYSQVTCLMLGLKLQQAAKLPDADASRELNQTAREIRNALITLGFRKRKVGKKKVKPETEQPAKKKGK